MLHGLFGVVRKVPRNPTVQGKQVQHFTDAANVVSLHLGGVAS